MATNVHRLGHVLLLCVVVGTLYPALAGVWSAVSEAGGMFRWYAAVNADGANLDRAISLAQNGTRERDAIAERVSAGELTVAEGLAQIRISHENDDTFQKAVRAFFPGMSIDEALRQYFHRAVLDLTTDPAMVSRIEHQFTEINRVIAEMQNPDRNCRPHSG